MCVYNTILALHIDTSALSDGTYELTQESEGGDPEVVAIVFYLPLFKP